MNCFKRFKVEFYSLEEDLLNKANELLNEQIPNDFEDKKNYYKNLQQIFDEIFTKKEEYRTEKNQIANENEIIDILFDENSDRAIRLLLKRKQEIFHEYNQNKNYEE